MASPASEHRLKLYVELNADVRSLSDGDRNDLRETFRDLVRLLNGLGAPYALFGAYAVAAYVPERRATADIDVVTARDQLTAVRSLAPRHGFRELPKEGDAVIRTFVHRTGVRLDVLFDEVGFADLAATQVISLEGIGDLRVASSADLAYSKLRTQHSIWRRDPQKRATDYGDLIALLRSDASVAPELYTRIVPRSHVAQRDVNVELQSVLMRACRDAGVDFPEQSLIGRLGALPLAGVVLAAVALIVGAGLLAFLLLR